MHQCPLFPADDVTPPARELARRVDPATSHEAAKSVKSFASEHHAAILRVLSVSESLGAEQVAQLTGLDAYQVRKRLPELERAGRARVAPGTRTTASGRSERLWLAVGSA